MDMGEGQRWEADGVPPPSGTVLSLQAIGRSFQTGPVTTEILTGVDLEMQTGDLMSIMGPSGSGKTTLMNIIGLLDRPSSGQYHLDGHDVAGLSDDALASLRNRRIGFVFQAFHLLPRLTATENVSLPLLYRGTPRRRAHRIAAEMLERVGMGDRIRHRPSQLSGGQKQRVAIARALIGDPALLLADEPTGALDSATATEVMDLLHDLNTNQGLTLLIITHDPQIARQCARQMRIQGGQLQERARPKSGQEAGNVSPSASAVTV